MNIYNNIIYRIIDIYRTLYFWNGIVWIKVQLSYLKKYLCTYVYIVNQYYWKVTTYYITGIKKVVSILHLSLTRSKNKAPNVQMKTNWYKSAINIEFNFTIYNIYNKRTMQFNYKAYTKVVGGDEINCRRTDGKTTLFCSFLKCLN